MKISVVGAAKFHADGRRTERRTDMTKLALAFHNFTNEPNKRYKI